MLSRLAVCLPDTCRLPPHPEQLPPLGPAPTLADSVQCVGSSFFRLVALNGSEW